MNFNFHETAVSIHAINPRLGARLFDTHVNLTVDSILELHVNAFQKYSFELRKFYHETVAKYQIPENTCKSPRILQVRETIRKVATGFYRYKAHETPEKVFQVLKQKLATAISCARAEASLNAILKSEGCSATVIFKEEYSDLEVIAMVTQHQHKRYTELADKLENMLNASFSTNTDAVKKVINNSLYIDAITDINNIRNGHYYYSEGIEKTFYGICSTIKSLMDEAEKELTRPTDDEIAEWKKHVINQIVGCYPCTSIRLDLERRDRDIINAIKGKNI